MFQLMHVRSGRAWSFPLSWMLFLECCPLFTSAFMYSHKAQYNPQTILLLGTFANRPTGICTKFYNRNSCSIFNRQNCPALTIRTSISAINVPVLLVREAVAYSFILLYTSWLVSLYSGHARWRLPQPPPPLVGTQSLISHGTPRTAPTAYC